MEKTLVLSRRANESLTLFVGGERVEVIAKGRVVLVVKADENVRVVRSELLDREMEPAK